MQVARYFPVPGEMLGLGDIDPFSYFDHLPAWLFIVRWPAGDLESNQHIPFASYSGE